MFAGVIRYQRQRDLRVRVICVTDGELAYPGCDGAALAAQRRGEQERSLGRLGVDLVDVERLGIPDGDVAGATDQVTAAIAAAGSELILAPWMFDHHCDHEAGSSSARAAALESGAQLFEGIFWGWHHTPPARLDGSELVHLALSAGSRIAKRDALGFHISQLMTDYGPPVLPVEALVPATWEREYYVRVQQ